MAVIFITCCQLWKCSWS